MVEGLWRVTQMLFQAFTEVRVNSYLFLAKRAPLQGQDLISSGCILEIINSFECSLS